MATENAKTVLARLQEEPCPGGPSHYFTSSRLSCPECIETIIHEACAASEERARQLGQELDAMVANCETQRERAKAAESNSKRLGDALAEIRADLRAEDKEHEHMGCGPYRRMAGRYLDNLKARAEAAERDRDRWEATAEAMNLSLNAERARAEAAEQLLRVWLLFTTEGNTKASARKAGPEFEEAALLDGTPGIGRLLREKTRAALSTGPAGDTGGDRGR